MVHEHHERGFPEEWISLTFARASAGNGAVAIVAGVSASMARDAFGPVAPFDTSLLILVIGTICITTMWTENYGNSKIELGATLSHAWETLISDDKIWMLGVIQSTFEGAMYIWVFMWTPALQSTSDYEILHGWVFATMMICVLIGSTLVRHLCEAGYTVQDFALYVFAAAAVAMFTSAMVAQHTVRLCCFFVFEACVGMFWPCLATQRSQFVPEDVRATVMNFFRMPLNVMVVTVLYNVAQMPQSTVFIICTVLLVTAAIVQHILIRRCEQVSPPKQTKKQQ
jgi:MFS transporter, MFS domain-containing protein family, molybdate-anion transporter